MSTLFFVVFIDLLGFGIVLPLLPRYAERFDAPEWQIGLLLASFSAMQFLFAPLWGRLSDTYGRRRLILLGLAGSLSSYLLFALADSYALLLVSRVLAGIFGATVGTAQAYIADVTGSRDRGRQMALIGAAFGVGFTFGPAIGGYAYEWFGMSGPGWVAATFSGAALLLALARLQEPANQVERAPRTLGGGALSAVRGTPHAGRVILLQFVAVFCFANFEGTLALVSDRAWGLDLRQNSLLYTYVGFCLLVAQGLLVRLLMPRYGERNLARAGSALLAAGLLGIALNPGGLPSILITLAVAVFGFAMLSPSLASLLSLHASATRQGSVLGASQSAQSLARILGPWVGVQLLVVNWAAPYWIGAGLMAMVLLGTLGLVRPKHA